TLASRAADSTFGIAITALHAPAAWDWTTDGKTSSIPDVWTVDATVSSGTTSAAQSLHVAIVDGQVTWFTDCGTPLP
ncbi:MAG: hypothetical protein ACHQDE_08820, partial [Acidimicrobiia bacterium]